MNSLEKTTKLRKKYASPDKKRKSSSLKERHSAAGICTKIDSFAITMRSLREMAEKEANLVHFTLKDMENNLVDPKYILELTKSIHGTGERSISDYVNRNTEILLNEHASVVRQQIIENMKKQMQEMSEQLTLNTLKLESNVSSFFELIDKSYHSASGNFHEVITLAKENFKKEELINQTKDELCSLQRDVQKLEEQLLESLMCYAFIQSLYPTIEWKNQFELHEDFLKSFGPSFNNDEKLLIQKKTLENIAHQEHSNQVEIPNLSATEIIKVIDRLKNSNLTLVHNSLLNKENMKFERKELDYAKEKLAEEIKLYDAKILSVESELQEAKEVHEKLTKQLKDVKEAFLKEDAGSQKENEIKKLTELYNICTGNNAKNVDIFLMKSAINYCLEDIFHELNKHPRKKIKEMLKALEVEKKIAEKKAEEALRAERLEKRLQKSGKFAGKRKVIDFHRR